MAELIDTPFGVVIRVKNSKGEFRHRKITPVTDKTEFTAGKYPFKLEALTGEENEALKEAGSSYIGAAKEGVISGSNKLAATGKKLYGEGLGSQIRNRASLLGMVGAENYEPAKKRIASSASEIEEQMNKEAKEHIAASKAALQRSEYYDHPIVTGIAEAAPSIVSDPINYIPSVGAWKVGAGILRNLARIGAVNAAANAAEEVALNYGDDTMSAEDKAKAAGRAALFGAAGGALLGAAARGAGKAVNAYARRRAGKAVSEDAADLMALPEPRAAQTEMGNPVNDSVARNLSGNLDEMFRNIPGYRREGTDGTGELVSELSKYSDDLADIVAEPGGRVVRGELPEARITQRARELASEPEVIDLDATPMPGGDKAFQRSVTSDEELIRSAAAARTARSDTPIKWEVEAPAGGPTTPSIAGDLGKAKTTNITDTSDAELLRKMENAVRWMSFDPKKNAAQRLAAYKDGEKAFIKALEDYGATPEDIAKETAKLKSKFENYATREMVSTMVTGPAGVNVNRINAKNDAAMKAGADYENFYNNTLEKYKDKSLKSRPASVKYEEEHSDLMDFFRRSPEYRYAYDIDLQKLAEENYGKFADSGFFYDPSSREIKPLVKFSDEARAALKRGGFVYSPQYRKWRHGKRKKDYVAAINSLDGIAAAIGNGKSIPTPKTAVKAASETIRPLSSTPEVVENTVKANRGGMSWEDTYKYLLHAGGARFTPRGGDTRVYLNKGAYENIFKRAFPEMTEAERKALYTNPEGETISFYWDTGSGGFIPKALDERIAGNAGYFKDAAAAGRYREQLDRLRGKLHEAIERIDVSETPRHVSAAEDYLTSVGGKRWVSPDGKVTRIYLDDNALSKAIGLEVERYKSGGVKKATLDGEPISNNEASSLLGNKIWYNVNTGKFEAKLSTNRKAIPILEYKLKSAETAETSKVAKASADDFETRIEIENADAALDWMIEDAAEKAGESAAKAVNPGKSGNIISRAAGNTTARAVIGGGAGVGKEGYDSYSEDRPFDWGNAAANAAIMAGASGTAGGMIIKAVGRGADNGALPAVRRTGGAGASATAPGASASSRFRGRAGGAYVSGKGKTEPPIDGEIQSSGKVKRLLQRFSNSRLGQILADTKLRQHTGYQGWHDEMLANIRKTHSGLEILAKGLNMLTTDEGRMMYGYMTNDIEGGLLPKELKELADKIKDIIHTNGLREVELGQMSKEAFDEWDGIYLHRTYDNRWGDAVRELFGKSKTINPIYARGAAWKGTKEELQAYLDDGLIGRISEGKIAYTENPDGTVSFRQDWSRAQREAWGERRDARTAIVETLARQYDNIYAGEFLQKIAGDSSIASKTEIIGWKRLDGRKFGALNGWYVPPEVKSDLTNEMNKILGYDDPIRRLWSKYLTSVKLSWTATNQTSHVNNVMSNAMFIAGSGMPFLRAYTDQLKSVAVLRKAEKLKDIKARQIAGMGRSGDAELYKTLLADKDVKLALEAEANGVFGASKVDEMLRNQGVIRPNVSLFNVFSKDQVINKQFLRAYQGEDNAGRLALFAFARERGLSPEAAAAEIRKIIPDYARRMSPAANFLRNTGIVPFVSWTYFTLPAIMKQLYGPIVYPFFNKGKMMKNPFYNKGIRQYQAYHTIKGVLGLTLLGAAIAEVSGAPLPWDGNQPRSWGGRRLQFRVGDDVYGVKVDRWSPYTDFTPGNIGGTAKNMIIGSPWANGLGLLTNNNFYYGTPITRRSGLAAAYDMGKYAIGSFAALPGYIRSVGGVAESALLSDDSRRRSNYYNPRGALSSAAGLGGLNVRSYNRDAYLEEVEASKLKARKKAVNK